MRSHDKLFVVCGSTCVGESTSGVTFHTLTNFDFQGVSHQEEILQQGNKMKNPCTPSF